MASRDDRGSDKGRVKVRLIEFEMEGSNQTLQNSIREMMGAIGRVQTPARAALTSKTNGASPTPVEDALEAETAAEDASNSFEADLGADQDEGRASPKKRFAVRVPQILDLDLKAGPVSLSEFIQKLKPESLSDKYVLVAYWLKRALNLDEITADHIHTGFRHLKWNTPADASQTLRTLKSRKYGYVNAGSKPGSYRLNHVGDNHASDLMKKAGTDL